MKKLHSLLMLLFVLSKSAFAAPPPVDNGQSVTIPVVVHILHSNQTGQPYDLYKLTVDQVNSQMTVLDNDFAGIKASDLATLTAFDNANGTNFASVASGPTGINFLLARRAPDGTPTDGIIYHEINSPLPTAVYNGSQWNAAIANNVWDQTKYLNIFVCPRINDQSELDVRGATESGIVAVKYNCFGTLDIGNSTPPKIPTGYTLDANFKEGGILTHETGHFFGLLHPWGPYAGWGDGIDDTPPQQYENSGCPVPAASYIQNGIVTMYMNFMDYPSDPCIYMFTQKQKIKMREVLFTYKSSLIDVANNPALQSLTCGSVDPGSFVSSFTLDANKNPVCNLTWNAANLADQYDISISAEDFNYPPSQYTQETKLSNIATTSASFNAKFDLKYRMTIYTTCYATADKPLHGQTPVTIYNTIPDPYEVNNGFSSAYPLNGPGAVTLFENTNTGLQTSTSLSSSLCNKACSALDSDYYSFVTFGTGYTNGFSYTNVEVKINQAENLQLMLYQQTCTLGFNTGWICNSRTNPPVLVGTDATTAGTKTILYRPCGSKKYKYWAVIKRRQSLIVNELSDPYKLDVKLFNDWSPICPLSFAMDTTSESEESFTGSVEIASMKHAIKAYPNPSNGSFTIATESGNISAITVYDVLGNTILEKPAINYDSYELDLHALPPGIYQADVYSENRHQRIRLIKN